MNSGAPIFSIVVNLARGMRLALAPTVLASIYRDLGSLKQVMIMASSEVPDWSWERMVSLLPERAQNYNIVSGFRIRG
ncbi:hypothetical protein KY284_035905 [Solanum tuberosum]|nr:hypothetical protein KY284_035905 [Solanum tuberosum]